MALQHSNQTGERSVVRAFIAIDLPDEVINRLRVVSRELQRKVSDVPVRWVPPENIHLTLKFLGDVSVRNLDLLAKMIQVEAAERRPFEFSVGGLGAFPGTNNPRVIWVGVEAPSELKSLQRGIETAASRLGYAEERREFRPHLTLGRVSRNANSRQMGKLRDVLRQSEVGFLGVAQVYHVHLFRSELRPEGSVYTRLYTAPLGR